MTAFGEGLAHLAWPNMWLALLAAGLLAGQHRGGGVPVTLLALGFLAGALVLAAAIRNPPSALALFSLRATTGFLIAIAWPLPWVVTAALAFATGAAVALNAPPQAVTLSGAAITQLGTALGAIAIFGLGALIAGRARLFWQQIAVRVIGSWIAASAILMLGLSFAR